MKKEATREELEYILTVLLGFLEMHYPEAFEEFVELILGEGGKDKNSSSSGMFH